MRSAKLMPAALTAIRTWPGPTGGSGRSSTRSTSGGPWRVMTTARIRTSRRVRARPSSDLLLSASRSQPTLQIDSAAREEPALGGDLVDHGLRHGRIGRQRHDGLVV